jgi:hypothetical protein
VVLIVCSSFVASIFVDYLMKRFYTARYLALKIGTNSKVFDLIGLLCCR